MLSLHGYTPESREAAELPKKKYFKFKNEAIALESSLSRDTKNLFQHLSL
jgi:hypothetical protein